MLKTKVKRKYYDLQSVTEFLEAVGCTLLSKEYVKTKAPLSIKCRCGTTFNRSFESFKLQKAYYCPTCSKKTRKDGVRLSYSKVRDYIQKQGCVLLSRRYKNCDTKLDIQCKCGKEFKRNWNSFKYQKAYYCSECSAEKKRNFNLLSFNDVKAGIEEKGCQLISTTYSHCKDKLEVKCSCGKVFKKNYNDFIYSSNFCCPACSVKMTSPEQSVLAFLKEIGIQNIDIKNNILIYPKEIDIYLPDLKIGIEINGLYWHTEITGQKDKKYHFNKWVACNEKDIRLIQITDNEWEFKTDKIKNLIKAALTNTSSRIYARDCEIKSITHAKAKDFINCYHLQGWVHSEINIGLFYNLELVIAMSFSKPRFSKRYQYELTRFCGKADVTCIGGASRLFKYFLKQYIPSSIISYCDISKFSGKMYEKLGFDFINISSPNYLYVKRNKVFSRYRFQKHKLKQYLKKFDPKLSEWQNMKNHNYDRYWDCGNKVFTWETTN